MISLPEKLIFPVPFAGGEGAELTPIALEQIADATDAAKVNFFDGFPSSYSAPHENGGNFVTRGQLNAIGNLASKNEYFRMCGGINTFDPVFAQKIGGYPKDAILDYFDGMNLFKVISLVENNKHDFRDGSFGAKWAKLGTNEIITGRYLLASYTDFHVLYSGVSLTGVGDFNIPKSGIVNIEVTSYSSTSYGSGTISGLFGTAFLGRSFSSDETLSYPEITSNGNVTTNINYNNYSIIPGLPSDTSIRCYTSGNIYKYPPSNVIRCKAGDIFKLAIQNGLKRSLEDGDELVISFNIYIQ
jgi:hypothetical protein